ncbi:hypothetical protein LEMLEM_LOCUS3129 [Lemmus lemmus]
MRTPERLVIGSRRNDWRKAFLMRDRRRRRAGAGTPHGYFQFTLPGHAPNLYRPLCARPTKLKESCNFIAKARLRFGGNRKRDFANENSDPRTVI